MPSKPAFSPLKTAILAGAILLPRLAPAVDLTVTRYDDPLPNGCLPADCSLREAVLATDGSQTADRILLSAGTYELTRPGADEDESLSGDLDIADRQLEIRGVAANLTRIDANGLDRVLDLSGSELDLTLEKVTITGGSAAASAAGVLLIDGAVTIVDSEIRANAPGWSLLAMNAHVAMASSTIGSGTAGALFSGGTQHAENLTITSNSGKTLYMQNGASMLCWQCTLGFGDGASADIEMTSASELELINSAILGDCSDGGGGAITSLDGNLESPGDTCGFAEPLDQVSVALPSLGVLQMNGGGTRTHLPSLASPLVGGANDIGCHPLDQRGVSRSGTNCEVGSTERAAVRPPIPVFIDGFEQGDAEAWNIP